MKEQELQEAKEWAKNSEDTNQYVERNLSISALMSLEEDPPNVKEAIRRLREAMPFGDSQLVELSDFIDE